jgi:uncharacterized Zn finger protein
MAERIRHAEKAAVALKKKGVAVEPVVINGREIARTWWGRAWNENLERYADYGNRLPRGRSYVRNGSVLDLRIAANAITALVAGSRPRPYEISIAIKPLNEKVRRALMEKSRSSLDSMQSLLSGEFPAELKESFLEKGSGLFPSPREIEFSCSCPDWASMCKHVAASLYGTAARLDEKPELFFILRGIKIDDFVGKMLKRESAKMLKKAKVKSARVIKAKDEDISKLFGIEMDGAKLSGRKTKPRASALPSRKKDEPVKQQSGKIVQKTASKKKKIS